MKYAIPLTGLLITFFPTTKNHEIITNTNSQSTGFAPQVPPVPPVNTIVLKFLTIFGNGWRIAGMPYFLHIATLCSFFIQVTPSIEAGELGAPPTTRYAQTVGEAPAGVASRPPILDAVF